jgi:hypothetical protein
MAPHCLVAAYRGMDAAFDRAHLARGWQQLDFLFADAENRARRF